jgi:hypothetical protein
MEPQKCARYSKRPDAKEAEEILMKRNLVKGYKNSLSSLNLVKIHHHQVMRLSNPM